MENIKEQFDLYTSQYDLTIPALNRKYYHSYRVMDLCIYLANTLNASKEDKDILTIAGLLHDYARFYQWMQYETFKDSISIDHGDKGVEFLFEQNEISKFCQTKEYYDKIYDAIRYHNKYQIPNDIPPRNQFICNIIRDADKLDILYLLGMNPELWQEDENEIDSSLKEQFFKKQVLKHKDIKNDSEKIISTLSMIFDIQFKPSLKHLKEHKIIDKLYDAIKQKEKFQIYFDFINQYIEERIDKTC